MKLTVYTPEEFAALADARRALEAFGRPTSLERWYEDVLSYLARGGIRVLPADPDVARIEALRQQQPNWRCPARGACRTWAWQMLVEHRECMCKHGSPVHEWAADCVQGAYA